MPSQSQQGDEPSHMEVIDLTADLTGGFTDPTLEPRVPSAHAVETSSSDDLSDDNTADNETTHGDFEQTDADAVAPCGAPEAALETRADHFENDSDSSKSDDEFDQEVGDFINFDNGNADSDSDAGSNTDLEPGCLETCQARWEKTHDKSQMRKFRIGESKQLIAEFRAKLLVMKTENRRLRGELAAAAAARSGTSRRTEAQWPQYLKWYLRRELARLPAGLGSYQNIYRLSCREMNIPPHPSRVLPGLVLREPSPEGDVPGAVESTAVTRNGYFDQLPHMAQFRVLENLLCFYGQKVHVLTRLDPYHKPSLSSGVLGNDPERPQPLRRFHVGDSSVSLTYATLPKVLLAPLVVCKKWLFWGAHLFYGQNTFAFSSLGE
ncbi:uncharacterized protein MAM_00673 [Metarhizium album ARSEF 1941]|uniref:Uncharacterized protein n=1 Tax=Metarhizium album (strain ARSEF 1941) TaxID=1081103 RepID=A0A0B2WZF3_METAS|nr:uncharacterized protein MAM_00673 [Metarhizium album ARSEF 1941]KHO01672.1 hypothetical protein MAM_00673 [Metarhizium album ARSEF 1941]